MDLEGVRRNKSEYNKICMELLKIIKYVKKFEYNTYTLTIWKISKEMQNLKPTN